MVERGNWGFPDVLEMVLPSRRPPATLDPMKLILTVVVSLFCVAFLPACAQKKESMTSNASMAGHTDAKEMTAQGPSAPDDSNPRNNPGR